MNTVHPVSEESVKPLVGQFVCAVLQDGSFYVGTVRGVENGEVILQGYQGPGTISPDPRQAQAQISGLGSLLGLGGGLLRRGGGLGAAGWGGIGGFAGGGGARTGLWGTWWPRIRLGIKMLSFLFPLLGRFFI
jgi:hypothetical protein